MRRPYLTPVALVALVVGGGLCARLSAQGFAHAKLAAPAENAPATQGSQPLARLVDFARAKTRPSRPSGALVAGYTQVDGLSLGASDYCPMPSAKIDLTATLSGSGNEKVKVTFSTGGSCEVKPGGSCTVPYTVPDKVGDIKATATAKGKTSNEITIKAQTTKDWSSEPALDAGELKAKLQKAGVAPPPTEPPVVPPTTGDPQAQATPTPTPAVVIPRSARRFAPGSTVSVSVTGAADKDTCTRCGINEEEQADELKYKWTDGEAGAGETEGGTDGTDGETDGGADEGSSKTITIPATVGQSIEVSVEVDDKGEKAEGDTGSRDDGAQTPPMTIYAATPDPNDPDEDGDGFPKSIDPDGDEPEPDPTPTPQPTATPAPNPTPSPTPPIVAPGASQLYWRVIQPTDAEDGTKPSLSGTLGGTVTVQVIVKVARKSRVAGAMNNFTVRLQEEPDGDNEVTHPFEHNHADFQFDLNDNHWAIWTSEESEGGDPPPPVLIARDGGSAKTENTTDDLNYFYTKNLTWNTTSSVAGGGGTLLGHNGEHTISLAKVNGQAGNSLLFQKKMPDNPDWEDAAFEAQSTSNDVGNLVITDVSTNQEQAGEIADYFKFDPQSEDDSFVHPTVSFDFAGFDQTASKDRYNWWLYIRATTAEGYSNFLTYEGKLDKPGQVEVSINKELSSYEKTAGNDLNDWGTYAFDVTIQDTKTGDSVRLRTAPEELKTAPRLVDLNDKPFKNADGENIVDEEGQLLPGHELVIEEDDRDVEVPLKFFYSYTLRGKKDASKVRIDLLGPDLKVAATKEGGTEIGEYNYLHLFTANDDVQGSEGSGWKGVLIARDNLGENYRDHKNRSALAINETKLYLPALWFQVGLGAKKIVNDGTSPGKRLPEIENYNGKGVIPLLENDYLHFWGNFRTNSNWNRTNWSFSITQGGAPVLSIDPDVSRSGTGKTFSTAVAGGIRDTPAGVQATVAKVRMNSPEGSRNATAVIERAPLTPSENDKIALRNSLSSVGKIYFDNQGLSTIGTSFLWHLGWPDPGPGNFSTQLQDVVDRRRGDVPPPNHIGRVNNVDAATHALLNAWLIRGIWNVNNQNTLANVQSDVLKITNAHEAKGVEDGDISPNIVMDLLNNRITRRANHLTNNLSGQSVNSYTNDQLFNAGLALLRSGGLVVVDEAAWATASNQDTAGLLVPTPLSNKRALRPKR